ncbi:hypothetical protein AZOA_19660 [Azoarcus sp. Aa7]|nr:hypothetical protein [Azoarcus sp. Aa7]
MINVDRARSTEDGSRDIIVTQSFLASLIIAAVVLAAYSVVLLNTFGVLDDYYFLHDAITGGNHTLPLLIGAGRPLNAVLLDQGFYLAGSIEGLSILRSITIIGIWLLGVCLYFFSRRHCVDYVSSLAIACGVILLPSFHVYASWAQHFTTPFAGVLAILSAFVLTPACAIRKRSRGLAIALAAVLLLIAIIIYQPLAMLFCTGVLLSVLSKPDAVSDWGGERAIDAVAAFVVAMLAGFIIFKIGQYLYPNDASRYGLVQDIYGKLSWFFSEPIANALSLYAVPRSTALQYATISLILLSALVFLGKYGLSTSLIIFVYGVLCLFGSYAPNLVTAENWTSYRSIGAVAASIVVMTVLLLRESVFLIRRGFSSYETLSCYAKYLWIPSIALLYLITVNAHGTVLSAFVLPNVFELNNLASFLRDAAIKKTERVLLVVRPASWEDSSARPMAYDEFGMPSSVRAYYAKPIVEIVVRSMNLAPNAQISVHGDLDKVQAGWASREVVVDFPRLVTSQRFKTDPLALLNSNPNIVMPLKINDDNWINGIWSNKENPRVHSFVYGERSDGAGLQAGDKVTFLKSGTRTVLRVDSTGYYANVLVDGAPLLPEDGYPNPVRRKFDVREHPGSQ